MATDLNETNCCNPVTPPTCTTRCSQFINACCVINEAPLDCIFEPVVTTATGTIGQFTMAVADATGIESGMLVTGEGVGEDAIVTNIEGTLVTVSVANIANFPGPSTSDEVTFHLIEQSQCAINEGINNIICELKDGLVPCREYTTVTLNTEVYNWSAAPGNLVQFSNKLNCEVRLRGILQATNVPGTQTFQIATTLFTIATVSSRPLVAQLLPTVVQIEDPEVDNSALHLPAFITITTSGDVGITIIHPNPCDPCEDGNPHFNTQVDLKLTVTLDGLTYETQA